MLQTLSQLKQLAITAAKSFNWQQAIKYNKLIVTQSPENLEALNRLGQAYIQTDSLKKAKKTFLSVLKRQKNNKLAIKNLEKIKSKNTRSINCFSSQAFIDEPGKAKNVQLHRLAGKQVLQKLSIGQACRLVPKNRYIGIETIQNNIYVGAIPEDISFRLSKLFKDGNQYSCNISACSDSSCCVYIKEISRSTKNKHLNSFATNKFGNISNINDEVILEKDIPVRVISTDDDDEPRCKISP